MFLRNDAEKEENSADEKQHAGKHRRSRGRNAQVQVGVFTSIAPPNQAGLGHISLMSKVDWRTSNMGASGASEVDDDVLPDIHGARKSYERMVT